MSACCAVLDACLDVGGCWRAAGRGAVDPGWCAADGAETADGVVLSPAVLDVPADDEWAWCFVAEWVARGLDWDDDWRRWATSTARARPSAARPSA